ncbi:MAG TPA: hypothetical protein VGM54_25325 [Chthoniobacter sp.]|jgi:hypothetical protein
MYRTILHLQSAIRTSLQKSPRRRIYRESLHACWPDLPEHERAQKIADFAAQNHWNVTVGDLGNLGVVAEFSRTDDSDGA